MDLIYYVPGSSTMDAEKASKLGLAYAVDGGGVSCTVMSPGPDGASGVVFSFAGADGSHVGFSGIANWTWKQIPNSTAWLGWDPEEPPTPADLRRKRLFAGYEVPLADGNKWIVPVVRNIDGGTDLPRPLEWNGHEWSRGAVVERYRSLFDAACEAWDALTSTETPIVSITTEVDLAVSALALNYRLGPAEISLLGLFDTDSEMQVVQAIIDWPGFLAIKKKRPEPGSPDGTPGGSD